jgi:PAS domain S-box-containing protein
VNEDSLEPTAPIGAPTFQDLIEAAPDAVVLADESGRIQLVNGQAERLFGYTRKELLGQSVDILLPARFREQHVAHRAAYARDPRHRPMGAGFDLYGQRKDGTEFPTEISLSSLATPQGRLVMAALRDVSDRKRMQQDLIEAAPDAVVLVDENGRIQLVNGQAERLFGYTRKELLGQSVDMLLPQRFRRGHAAHREGYTRDPRYRPMGAGLDLFGQRKDGTEFPTEISLSSLATEHGRVVMAAIRDVTESKRLQREREQAIQGREELLSLVSHDLQNAVNVLVLNTMLLLRTHVTTEREAGMQRYGQIVHDAAVSMGRLIRDLIDARQIEGGRFGVNQEREDVRALTAEVVEALQALAAPKSIVLAAEIAPGLGEALCDRERIYQVLNNLIGNAIKFTPDGGRVQVEVRNVEDTIQIGVVDSGPGIAAEDVPHVFDRHWQGEGNARRRGTGLGLYIVKAIVEAHGGRIWVENQPQSGAGFHFTLERA